MNRKLPSLIENLKNVGIQMEMMCKKIEDDRVIETQHIELPEIHVPKEESVRKTYRKEEAVSCTIAELQVGMRSVIIEVIFSQLIIVS